MLINKWHDNFMSALSLSGKWPPKVIEYVSGVVPCEQVLKMWRWFKENSKSLSPNLIPDTLGKRNLFIAPSSFIIHWQRRLDYLALKFHSYLPKELKLTNKKCLLKAKLKEFSLRNTISRWKQNTYVFPIIFLWNLHFNFRSVHVNLF